MHAIKEIRKFIQAKPHHDDVQILSKLVLALEQSEAFSVHELYALDYERFKMALELIKEWRLDRYYASKAKLFDLSFQMHKS